MTVSPGLSYLMARYLFDVLYIWNGDLVALVYSATSTNIFLKLTVAAPPWDSLFNF
jgi:hypothetical protein